YGVQSPDEAKETWDGASHMDAVVLTGVPFRGSMTIFRNMQYGRHFGLNTTLLDQEAVASFPASYFVLPTAEGDLLLTPRLEPVHVSVLRRTPFQNVFAQGRSQCWIRRWRRNRDGPFSVVAGGIRASLCGHPPSGHGGAQ